MDAPVVSVTSNGSDLWLDTFRQQTFGFYQPSGFIHAGNFGYVYDATDARTGRSVVLKILRPFQGPEVELEFQDEGRFLAKLARSSSVINLLETGRTEIEIEINGTKALMPVAYHALERGIVGLHEYLLDEGIRNRLPWKDKLRYWRGAIRGLHQMHLKGIVHRDLKAENCIVVNGPGGVSLCKVTDLGRSRDLSESRRFSPESYATGRGDRRFAPPEYLFLQASDNDNAEKAADLYGIGSLFFEIATGQPITFVALGHGPDLVQQSQRAARAGYYVDLEALRQNYITALSVLRDHLPRAIQHRACGLVRRLCDPVPSRRFPVFTSGQTMPPSTAFEWLFREVDIMSKVLVVPPTYWRRRRTS